MRIALGNNTLSTPGGTETYTLTIAAQLQRLGHDVWIHANEQGVLCDRGRQEGLQIAERLPAMPEQVDAVLANDAVTALQLAERYPQAPLVFVGHSDIFDSHLPPRLPGLLAGVVAMYDRVERRLRGMDLQVQITRLAQPVDVELFKPLAPLPAHARRVLVMGNYHHGERLRMIERACVRAGLECVHVGGHADRRQTLTPVQTLCEADIVLGKARVVIEAMACGRAVYSLDHNGGDGWVTAATYAVQAADNFGGQATDVVIDEDRLVADLAAYDPVMGQVNRDLAIRHHAATRHAAELAALLAELAPRPAPVPGPLAEMARLVRTSWQHEGHAFALYSQIEGLQLRLHEVDVAARAAQAEVLELRREREAADGERAALRQRAEDADAAAAAQASERALAEAQVSELRRWVEDFRATRRFKVAGWIARPLDWLRRRMRSGR